MKNLVTLFMIVVVLSMGAFGSAYAQEQVTLKGIVTDASTSDPLPGVSVFLKGTQVGTSTDENGAFSLEVSAQPPYTLVFSFLGFAKKEVGVSVADASIAVVLEQSSILGDEVVISASRVEERILESPVSIEKMNAAAIKQVATPSFYDALPSLKGVESSVQSLTFRSISTRGFNSNGNTRFNQFVDGMDNQAPGLNFSVGNIVGIPELDVASVELLPGAASALYGAGGTNGTLLMTSKNPFEYQGLSVKLSAGMNHVDTRQQSSAGFIPNVALRYARAVDEKFAFKINAAYVQADDWQAENYENFDRLNMKKLPGTSHADDANYDGVNVYGDEINANMQDVANAVIAVASQRFAAQYEQQAGMPPSQAQINAFLSTNATTQPFYLGLAGGVIPDKSVSRTGYREENLVDYGTKSLKLGGALHYKFTNNLEGILQVNWGNGTSVYTGSDRYSLRDFTVTQIKAELRGDRFFLRGYTTQERSGESYNATALGSLMNETWKQSTQWFPEYVGAFVGATSQGADAAQAHMAARQYADQGRFVPGTDEFAAAKDTITSRFIGFGAGRGGAKFNDKTNLYHYEGMYNFSDHVKVFELLAGASVRRYALQSDGTIFDDADQDINIDEYGAFIQASKKLANDRVKLTGSMRYDKNENFEGRFTPRISGVFTVARDNNIRLSYQTGFRNPTTQNQYIDLLVRANTRLIGGLPEMLEKYDLYQNQGYTLASVQQGAPKEYSFDDDLNAERVQAYEIGYRGLISRKLMVDAYYYYNIYNDFISTLVLLQTPDGMPNGLATGDYSVFSTVVNNPSEVKTQGWAFGLDYVHQTWRFRGNVSANNITDESADLFNSFNTPKIRYNLGVGNRNVYKNLGFNISYRWQDTFNWFSTFAAGEVPAFGTLDAQVNYEIPTYNLTLKLGGSNVLNKYYYTSYGNPSVGAIYYLSVTFNSVFK